MNRPKPIVPWSHAVEEVFSQKECKYFYLQEINGKSLTSVQSLLEKMVVLCDRVLFFGGME